MPFVSMLAVVILLVGCSQAAPSVEKQHKREPPERIEKVPLKGSSTDLPAYDITLEQDCAESGVVGKCYGVSTDATSREELEVITADLWLGSPGYLAVLVTFYSKKPTAELSAAGTLLGGRQLTVVTVDMPLSTAPITGRRTADAAISKAYGGRGAAVHSPSSERPGAISDQLTRDFAAMGFPLATGDTPVGTPHRLVEVYPHPALMTLTGAGGSLPYKVSRSRRYWPKSSPAERRAKLLTQFAQIASALKGEIRDIPIELPDPDITISTSGLKRYEDSLDALVCAWVGAKYLLGEAVPYSDCSAAIWVP